MTHTHMDVIPAEPIQSTLLEIDVEKRAAVALVRGLLRTKVLCSTAKRKTNAKRIKSTLSVKNISAKSENPKSLTAKRENFSFDV